MTPAEFQNFLTVAQEKATFMQVSECDGATYVVIKFGHNAKCINFVYEPVLNWLRITELYSQNTGRSSKGIMARVRAKMSIEKKLKMSID